jgi:hypothetical protein
MKAHIAGAAIAADEMAHRSQRLRGLQSLRPARHLIGYQGDRRGAKRSH